jgi:hypothetical protein
VIDWFMLYLISFVWVYRAGLPQMLVATGRSPTPCQPTRLKPASTGS